MKGDSEPLLPQLSVRQHTDFAIAPKLD